MTDEERIACASALGYGEGIAYDENQKAIAPMNSTHFSFTLCGLMGFLKPPLLCVRRNQIKGQEQKVFSVV